MLIDDVRVDERRRHQGIGMALMLRCFEVAREQGVDCIELLVNGDNVAAKGLYRKVGFKNTGKEHQRLILRHFTK
jgi:ribosomal protein S18 acetylase RimI-like enzyme